MNAQGLPLNGVLYGYRVGGPQGWENGHRFDSKRVLLDPYAKFVDSRRRFGDAKCKFSHFLGTYDFSTSPFDWGADYQLPAVAEVMVECSTHLPFGRDYLSEWLIKVLCRQWDHYSSTTISSVFRLIRWFSEDRRTWSSMK